MLAQESNNRYNSYNYKIDYQKGSSKSVFSSMLQLAKEGKIDSNELEVLLSFYAAKYVSKKVENKIGNFINCDCRKFFQKRFLNE